MSKSEHRALIHARCPLVDQWDYYDVIVEPDGFLDVILFDRLCDEVRGIEATQETLTNVMAEKLRGHMVRLEGRHSANSITYTTATEVK